MTLTQFVSIIIVVTYFVKDGGDKMPVHENIRMIREAKGVSKTFVAKGLGMSLVHVNSYPMVVELCSNKKIGRFTGLYYASSIIKDACQSPP